ncbi:hypothetical protein AHAT_42370 [Agarivorans sp. Toyoura001]|uniref:hypothetical protein n=1 Tax=Agarivorans sp. Toyoura001 TaxID=2283141 RepID=UPI0010F02F44|nr:hypothetical protein [Agarivorans sp. Toyoura001]GDY28347.1 hypothetical protein AHAT_42370 [Agarivorans sp. Toyoura001]
MRILVFCAFIMLIQGCASTQGIASKEVAAKSKIFIASQLNNEFNFQVTGTTAFQNKKFAANVEHWELNSHVENRVINQLKGVYSPQTYNQINDQLTIPSDNYLTGYSNAMTSENGLNILKKQGFDYVLFITSIDFQDAYYQTNQYVEGYGIYNRSFFGSDNKIVYSQISFTLFDVNTGKFLASNGDTGHNGGDSVWITHKNITISKDISNLEQLNEIVENYKSDVFTLTNNLVDKSIKYMGFQVQKL